MLLPHKAVIALVDGKKFEMFRNIGNEASPELAEMAPPKLDEHNKGRARIIIPVPATPPATCWTKTRTPPRSHNG